MRNCYDRAVFEHVTAKRGLQQCICLDIDSGSGFVEYEYVARCEESAGERDELPLS